MREEKSRINMKINPKNIKLLTDSELREITNKYSIERFNDIVVVTISYRNQTTVHKRGKKFNLRVGDRKFTITNKALQLWENELSIYNLLEIQHFINYLIINKELPTVEKIEKLLKSKNEFN